MLNGHLSDEQIQELALGNTGLAQQVVAHAEQCAACRLKLHNYRLLINTIEKEPAPSFGFDLAAAVVAQIETPAAKPVTRGLWWLFVLTIVAILTGAAIYFGEYLSTFAEQLKSLSIYLVAISGIVLTVLLVIDQYKNYNRKMKILDMP